jgi:hypothetical protein
VPVDGSPENPVEIIAPGELDRVAARAARPTPGQAAAGNYRKAHVVIGGLSVTIETPLDGIRSGVSPKGVPWAVRMPAHYGYVKGTEGADGDHVDLYIGPEAHRAHRLPVWVVDQVDADTRKFDEHKALVGFTDVAIAKRTYASGFSDGRGMERMGALVRMAFDDFKQWLGGDTKQPLAYGRTAKAKPLLSFSASAAPRTRPDNAPMLLHPGGPGDSMTTTAQARAESPQGAGYVARIIKSVWGRMTPEERLVTMQDAAVASTLELGKATDLLEGGDRAAPGQVEDLFDGPPDDRLETVEAGGPNVSVPAGKVGVGKPQQASGAGAATMEREYSRHAPQTGVQRATEELGAKLAAQGRVMKSLIAFGKSIGDRLSMVEASLPTAGAVDAKAIEAAVAAAVAKAIPQAVSAALGKAIPAVVKAVAQAKAEGETEADKESGEDDEEDDEEADEAESGSGTEIEITNENEEEGEDEAEDDAAKATRKAAAQQRLTAKALVKLAKAAERDSREAMEEGRLAAGKRQHMKAEKRMAKARLHVAVAKSLRDGGVGASMKAIEASIGTVAKALKEAKAKNQDKWPAGKSAAAPVVAPQGEDLAKAVAAMTAAVEKANAGYALMTTNVQGLMAVVGGQSRDPSSGGVPPVGALFKAVPAGKESQINALVSDGTITMRERDKAIDALGYLRVAGVPETVVNAAIDGCSPAVQAILRAAA